MEWTLFSPLKELLRQTVLSPIFLAAVSGILVLERLIPVNPKQRTLSVGFAHDAVWVVLTILFQTGVVVFYANGIRHLYETHFHFLTLEAIRRQPEWLRFVIGVLLGDFLAWFQHWLKHQIPWFWHIHSIHHSQKELNLFTDYRFHFFEYFISRPIVLLPLMIFGVDDAKVAVWGVLTTWQARFYHANIKTNLGWLRHLVVTPQSHRIHHSIESRHFDLNYGVIFSFWDRLFRTHYAGCNEYPETGIANPAFPLEARRSFGSLVAVPLKQLAYPFTVLFRKR